MSLPTTSMTSAIAAIRAALDTHAWPSPITQIGLRGPTDLIQADSDSLRLATPALYLHLTGRRGEESNDERRPIVGGRVMRLCQWQIYCLLGQTTPDLPIEMYEMTEAVMALIERREYAQAPRRGHRWGLGAAMGYPQSLEDGDADLGLQGVAARVVQWEQSVYLSELEPIG